jgi:hypothetical protein
MIVGDLVRFAKWGDEPFDVNNFSATPKTRIGILIEYSEMMGTMIILYEGELVTCRPSMVEKAGKKDLGHS